MHNAFITIDQQKIAKSVGNGITLRHLVDKGYSSEIFRYWLLTGHYRTQMNFTFEALDGAKQALFRLKRHIFEEYIPQSKRKKGTVHSRYWKEFMAAMSNDLDAPKALSILWNVTKDKGISQEDKIATLYKMDTVLGIGLRNKPADIKRELGIVDEKDLPEEIQKRIEERETARKEKDWARADELRQELNMQGYSVEDTPDGPKITRV